MDGILVGILVGILNGILRDSNLNQLEV